MRNHNRVFIIPMETNVGDFKRSQRPKMGPSPRFNASYRTSPRTAPSSMAFLWHFKAFPITYMVFIYFANNS